jgi:hypothetical protein
MKKTLLITLSVILTITTIVGISVLAYNKKTPSQNSNVKFMQFVPQPDGKTIEQFFAENIKPTETDDEGRIVNFEMPEPQPTDVVYYNEQPTEVNYQRKIDFIKKSSSQSVSEYLGTHANYMKTCMDESTQNNYNLKLIKALRNGEIQCYVDNLK